jgi:hypothetical protein
VTQKQSLSDRFALYLTGTVAAERLPQCQSKRQRPARSPMIPCPDDSISHLVYQFPGDTRSKPNINNTQINPPTFLSLPTPRIRGTSCKTLIKSAAHFVSPRTRRGQENELLMMRSRLPASAWGALAFCSTTTPIADCGARLMHSIVQFRYQMAHYYQPLMPHRSELRVPFR